MDPKHRELLQTRIAELKSKIGTGGLREAGIRALLYVGSARGMVDERSLEALRRLRQADESARITLAEFKMLVREQFFMLLLDREAALAAIPKLLPASATSGARRSRPSGGADRERREYPAKWQAAEADRRLFGLEDRADRRPLARRRPGERHDESPASGDPCNEAISAMAYQAIRRTQSTKYDRLIAAAKKVPPAVTIVVHPCDESSLRGVVEAAQPGIIVPILVGSEQQRSRRCRQARYRYQRDMKSSMRRTARPPRPRRSR